MSYPLQYFRFGLGDTDNCVASSGSTLVPTHEMGNSREKWYLNYISSGVYQIANVSNNQLLTSNGSQVFLSNNSNSEAQKWNIEGIQKDYEGYYLYYKITPNSDKSKSLTYSDDIGFSLSNYSGANYQKYKLNLDGLEGFAANCKTSSGEKAGTIGGLLGPAVFVNNADELESRLKELGPLTIVVNANIDMIVKSYTRIRDYKTIVGSFKYKTIIDSHLLTNSNTQGDTPSDNIVFRNLDFQSKAATNRILINIYSSRNIWIDHISFTNSLSYNRKGNGQDEVGKFIWLNTTYDGVDLRRSPDYMTISYCKFTNRFWTVAYGTQNGETTRDRTTLLYNWWNQNVRRCPQLGNGSAHIFNNYYSAYGQRDNGGSTTGIIGGDGSEMLSQNNMFNGYTKQQALQMGGDTTNPARDDNSYISGDLNATPVAINFSSKKNSNWNPNQTNYGYRLLDAYNSNNTDTKTFCTKYAGCFNSQNNIKYVTDSDFSGWAKTYYASPFLKHVDLSWDVATLTNGATFKIKNSNSGLYMQVAGGLAENGTNVQQWGTSEGTVHDIWKVVEADKGYYYLISGVGDGGSFALDVHGKSNQNGANVEINQYEAGSLSQQFKLSQNGDGSYIIKTRISDSKSAVEISYAGVQSGDNVQQWQLNANPCQNWIFEPVRNPGCRVNSEVVYEIENLNSGKVMDIADGKLAENTNVQQKASSHLKTQQWVLQQFDNIGNYYYIRSAADNGFVLKPSSGDNGGNIMIVPFNNKDSGMLFLFSKNPDGTYFITDRMSKEELLLEVANAGADDGNNVQHWVPTNHACQKWKLNIVTEVKKDAEETKLKATKNSINSLNVVKTKMYKDKDCVHTVVFVK